MQLLLFAPISWQLLRMHEQIQQLLDRVFLSMVHGSSLALFYSSVKVLCWPCCAWCVVSDNTCTRGFLEDVQKTETFFFWWYSVRDGFVCSPEECASFSRRVMVEVAVYLYVCRVCTSWIRE